MVEQIEAGINDAASILLIGTLALLSLLGISRAVDPVTWQRNENGVE